MKFSNVSGFQLLQKQTLFYSAPFLVHLSSNGSSDLFVFRMMLFGSGPVQCLMADIMASKTGIFVSDLK